MNNKKLDGQTPFPKYVPEPIKQLLRARLDGDAWEPHGWRQSLLNAEQDIEKIKCLIEEEGPSASTYKTLKEQLHALRQHRDQVREAVNFLERLGCDQRMKDVFSLLVAETPDERELVNFFSSAWIAQGEYHQYRQKTVNTERLTKDIATAAEKLSHLIDKFSDLGVDGPPEFHSVHELLLKTDNIEDQGRNLRFWQHFRLKILGPSDDSMLRYTWDTAPSFTALLGTISRAATEFRFRHSEIVQAAIVTRQENSKYEYLRAFIYQLRNESTLNFTPDIKEAMAIVCEVCLDDPDQDVSSRDVNEALKAIKINTNST